MAGVRHNQQTRARVLREFAECGRIDLACARAGCNRSCHYDWLKNEPEYRAAYELARTQAADLLEAEAHRRAYEGVTKPVYQQGQKVGEIQEYSDSLLSFLLMARIPKVYGKRVELAGDPNAPLIPHVVVEFVGSPKKEGE